MKPKYCLPIVKNSKEEVLQTISENSDYDFYEIWLSYIKDLDTDFIWKISSDLNGKLIFLFRKQNLDKSDLEKATKEKIIRLLETSDNFLDLDINDQKEEIDFIKNEKLQSKLIVSYHNYQKTPDSEELEKIISELEKLEPEIYKISTFCNSKEDGLTLLRILLDFNSKKVKKIILGMGESGLITRIFGTLWGNEMVFAPIHDVEQSADGQITKERMEKILGDLMSTD